MRALHALAAAQAAFCDEIAAVVRSIDASSMLGQFAVLHVELTKRVFEVQREVLHTIEQTEREVTDILMERTDAAAQQDAHELLNQAFPGLASRDWSTRLRLEELGSTLAIDESTVAEFARLLADHPQPTVAGVMERTAVTSFTDDLWCAGRALRRAMLDDAHAQVVLGKALSQIERVLEQQPADLSSTENSTGTVTKLCLTQERDDDLRLALSGPVPSFVVHESADGASAGGLDHEFAAGIEPDRPFWPLKQPSRRLRFPLRVTMLRAS